MANGASDVGSRSFALPLALVGALAAGALAPHLAAPPAPSMLVAPPARAAGPVLSVAGSGQDRDHVTTALDLLAEYFGIDISPAALRREMRSVARQVLHPEDYSGPKRTPTQQARLLRAFFCMGVRTSGTPMPPNDGFGPLWQELGTQDPAPPGCPPVTNTAGRKKGGTLPQPALWQSAALWIEAYLNDDARRDHVTVTRALADGRAAKLVDQSRLLADDFDRVDKTPLAWELVYEAADRHNTSVQVLIATVPDPVDSYESWRFDPYVDAIRQGIEKSGYLLDRFYLPDVDPERKADPTAARKELHTETPGVILFRWSGSISGLPNEREPLLVLFLVPETPVAGIHAGPFVSAIEFARDWMPVHTGAAGDARDHIRILGPSFSGSTPSMVRALRDAHDLLRTPTLVTIISGGATVDTNRKSFEEPDVPYGSSGGSLTVHFRATTERDAAVSLATNCFLQEAGIQGLRAVLSEGSTAYGSTTHGGAADDGGRMKGPRCAEPTDPPLTMKYPFNVSQLRNDVSRAGAPRRDPLAGVIPRLRPLALEDTGPPTDQLPLVRPDAAVSAIELVLSNQLDAVRDSGVRVVTITATDVRDKLFLVKELREHVPDALPIIDDTDLFQVHPDQARWLKGVVVVSTYPLRAWGDNVPAPGYPRNRVQFSGANVEGTYNAAIALLNYDIDGTPNARFQIFPKQLPRLADYSAPGCGESREPALWVSVVGNGRIVPLRVYCGFDAKFKEGYVFKPQPATAVPPAVAPAAISVSRPAVALILLILALAAAGITRFAVVWFARPAGPGPEASPLIAEREALALALCGPLIPLAYLGVTLPALMVFQCPAGDTSSALLALAAAAIGLAEAGLSMAAQCLCRSPRYWPFRACFLAAAVGVGVYAVLGLRAAPELLLTRTFDVGAMVSPLVPVSVFGVVPALIAVVELWRLRALGGRGCEHKDVPAHWTSSLHDVARWTGIRLDGPGEGLEKALERSHSWVLGMPLGWLAVSFVATLVAYGFTFGLGPRPVLSVEGQTLAGLGVFFVVLLQWFLMASLTRFSYAAYYTCQFLARAADHALDLPYDTTSNGLFSFRLIPARPQLRELRSMAALVGGGSDTLDTDLKSGHPRPRWFQSATWAQVKRAMETPDELEHYVHRRELVATSLVLVVRELLSRLSVSLGFIGPALALLLTLQGTLPLDRSHCLLGLVWADVILSSVVVMGVFVGIERDAIVSRMFGTKPGLQWNVDFISKVVVYVVIPLATVFAAQFPELGSSVLHLLEPVQRLPGG